VNIGFQLESELDHFLIKPVETLDGHLALFGADPNALGQLDKHLGDLLGTKVYSSPSITSAAVR
jgi:hypothetical protein